jgi:CRP-like cAMP-binding protein
MAIQLKIVRSSADKAQVYRLRYLVFIEEENRFDIPTDHIYDRFDSFEETTNILALKDGEPVAGIRVIMDGPIGLPVQHAFNFEPLRRTLTGGCASIGWFCVRKAFRRHPGLVVSLIQMCFRHMRKHNARHVLALLHPPFLSYLKRLVGAQALSPEFMDPHLKVGIVPVHVDLENLPPGSRERFVDPPEHLFEDSTQRRLYRRKEVIFTRGDSGNEVFQVMRGVVRAESHAHSPTGNGNGNGNGGNGDGRENLPVLIGPGQIFGEVSALDGRGRTVTAVTHSEDVDLMVWDNTAVMDQLLASPERMLGLYRVMADRLRRTLNGSDISSSTALAARLLVGASGQNNPVDVRWLAGQCGLDRRSLTGIVMPWAEDRLVEADDGQERIWVVDRKRLAHRFQMQADDHCDDTIPASGGAKWRI